MTSSAMPDSTSNAAAPIELLADVMSKAQERVELVVRAEVGAFPLWSLDGTNVVPNTLPLSPRVLIALEDWTQFFDDVGGAMSDSEIVEEFVGQGYKIAHAIRRELKGSSVWLQHPLTDELVPIERPTPH